MALKCCTAFVNRSLMSESSISASVQMSTQLIMSEEQQASQQSQAKIKLGDTEYDFSSLSDPAKQLVAALRSSEAEMKSLRNQMALMDVGRRALSLNCAWLLRILKLSLSYRIRSPVLTGSGLNPSACGLTEWQRTTIIQSGNTESFI